MKYDVLKAILLVSSMLAGGCEQSGQAQDKANDILLRAQGYFDQGQYSAASIEARNALKENDKNIDAYLLLARIYHEQGNYGASVKTLLELPNDNLEVVVLLGNNYLKQKKFKSLDQLLATVATRADAKQSWDFNRLQSINLILQDKPDQALKQIELLVATASTADQKASSEVVRSFYLGQNQQPEQQMQALDKALILAPNHVEALLEKARLQFARKDYEAAEDLLSQALIALPRTDNMTLQRLEVLQAMASTLSRQNRSGEAMIYSKLIAEANPKAQEIQTEFEQGIEKLKEGDVKTAEEVFSKLYMTDHARMAGSILGLIRFQQGDFKEAAQFFEETIDPETASPEMLRAFAESQLRMRNPEQALKTIEANANEHPNNPDILGVYGLALLATGKTEPGIEQLNRALEIDPSRARLRLALATALNSQGKPDAALQQIEAAFATDKSDIAIQERLVAQYAAMNKGPELLRFSGELSALPAVESQALAGLVLLRMDPKRGTELLNKLYATSPSEPAVLRAQLRMQILSKNYREVVRFGKLLVANDPNDIAALGAIVRAYDLLGASAEAESYLNEQIARSANAWGPEHVLAMQSLRERDFTKATGYINNAVAKSAYNPVTTRLYGQIHQAAAAQQAQMGNYARAREIIMDAMQNNEVTPQLLHLLIKVELADNNPGEADKLVAELNQSAQGSPVAYHAQGDIAAYKKDNAAAMTHYRSAWSAAPNDILAGDMWTLLKTAGNTNKETFLAEWAEKVPQSSRARTFAGIFYQEAGQRSKAVENYRASLAINASQPVVLNNLAWLLMEDNKLSDAFAYAEKAVKLAGNNPSVLDTFGWIAFKSGKKDVALESLEKAASLQPDNEEIKAHLDAVRKG